ncbi:UNKNOWN [Stylonychia lemnae]|uniref:Uncharacterized protein n=1 Tax=Stylonychia lemnae TaxID=5949 RepID=A0A077ZW84_STYLE|nr:UNKNOWN [Stylonychia lemnae]|eukprot:CDW73525.1 UNKNOWN [Stylonychia lemnae]
MTHRDKNIPKVGGNEKFLFDNGMSKQSLIANMSLALQRKKNQDMTSAKLLVRKKGDQFVTVNGQYQNDNIQNKFDRLSETKKQDEMGRHYKQRNLGSEITLGYNTDYKLPVDQRTTRHLYHDKDFFKSIKATNIIKVTSSDREFASQNKFKESKQSKEFSPYPQHVEKRNMRNDSSLSLKQDSENMKQEMVLRKKLIGWAQQKNQISIQGLRSFKKNPEIPNPPQPQQQSVILKKLMNKNFESQQSRIGKQMDVAQIRAQAIINKESLYRSIAGDFSRARSMIKSSNYQEIDEKKRASIYGSKYFQIDSYNNSHNNLQSRAGTDLRNQAKIPIKSNRIGNLTNQGTSFKIGDYNFKLNNAKKTFRTTFQDQYIQKQINSLDNQMCKESQTRNVSIPLNKARNLPNSFLTQSKQDYQNLFESTNSLNKSINSATSEQHNQYSRPGRISIDKMIHNSQIKLEYNTVYHNKYREGLGIKSLKQLKDDHNLNKSLKKDVLDSHFQLGGRSLVSADLNSPLHLLEADKRLTYFKEKPFSKEQNELRSKFKDKIERQNWNIKQQKSLDVSQEMSRDASYHKINRSLSDIDLYRSSRPQSNLSMTAHLKQSSNFNLGYQRNSDTNRIMRNSTNFDSSASNVGYKNRDDVSQFKQNYDINRNHQNRKTNLNLGRSASKFETNYKDQYPWQVPKYEL